MKTITKTKTLPITAKQHVSLCLRFQQTLTKQFALIKLDTLDSRKIPLHFCRERN